jgi:DNA replication protein DnaC
LPRRGLQLDHEPTSVSRTYERTSLMLTIHQPFPEWVKIMGSERLTGALLDRLTHRVHIIEANGPSYRLG